MGSLLSGKPYVKLFVFVFLLQINCFIIFAENDWYQNEQGKMNS
jgi:hypothetical protein